MEESGAMSAKKIWRMVRALYYMLRKGKSNKKFMLDLNMMIKRGKVAGKSFHNFMFHHKDATVERHHLSSNALPGEYVFSCSNTPLFHLNTTPRNGSSGYRFFLCAHALPRKDDDDDVVSMNIAAMKALEMLQSEVVSPPLPGFGRSPVVRQVLEEESHVDEAAEEFINKFYKDLKKQQFND